MNRIGLTCASFRSSKYSCEVITQSLCASSTSSKRLYEPDWITCGDPSTPARSLPRSFALLRSARLFHLFAFECKHSTLINKKSSSASLKRICEPDWIRTNGLLLRRQLLYPTELPVLNGAKIMYFSYPFTLILPL
jgi:hypothetical protein